ncbi:MAG: M1 family metallopeptidase [Anaerolineae bacterium]
MDRRTPVPMLIKCLTVFFSLLLLLACSPAAVSTPIPSPVSTVSSPENPLRPEFATDLDLLPDAPRYEIWLTVDPELSQVTGQQQVRYTNTDEVALDCLYFRLFPNTPGYGGEMTVGGLTVNGGPVTPTTELADSALRVPLEPSLGPGQTVTVHTDFTVTVPTSGDFGYAQLSWLDGVMALPNVYPLIPVYDDEGWNVELAPEYGDAVYSDVAFYTVRVTLPSTFGLMASGSCTTLEQGEHECSAALMREFALVLGEDHRRASRVVEGVLVNSYFYSDHQEGGLRALQIAADALSIFSELFGPYPYAELDVVETPTRAGGIEYPGLVVIGDRLYEAGSRLEWVVAHEVGHQWWYGVVGNDQVDEPWLDEALVQYSTFLYHEVAYGSEMAADILDRRFVQTQERLVDIGEDMPVGLPVAAYDRGLYASVVYGKGPLYFHALREEVGDEVFFDILRAYYRRHRYGIATPDSFLTTVDMVAGDPHRALFERWISGVSGE